LWDLTADRQVLSKEHPLLVARCNKIIRALPQKKATGEEEDKYMINVRQYAKFVVKLGDDVAETDIEEGMRVGVDRAKYSINLPLPPRIDPTVTMMTVSMQLQLNQVLLYSLPLRSKKSLTLLTLM